MLTFFLPAVLDEGVERLCFERDHGSDLLVIVEAGADGADLVDPGHDGQPFGAFSFHLCPVLPQGELQLVRNMPQTALIQDLYLPCKPIQDGGVSIRHQEKARELLECLEALFEKTVPVPVVGADIDSRHPDRSAFHILHQDLQLLAPFLDATDADSRAIRLAPGLSLRVKRKGDLFPGFLHRLPDGHLVDRRPKGRHELLRHPEGRQRPQKPQLPSDLRRDPLVGIQPQQHPGDRELMAATRTLDLHLPKLHPGEGRQHLRRLAAPRLPDEMFVIAALPTGEGLLSPGHQKLSVEPEVCHYSAKVGNSQLKLSGFSVSEEADQLDLFVSIYDGVEKILPISDTETKTAAEQCLRFLSKCAEGKLAKTMDESNDAYQLALTIQESYPNLDQIRIYVITDRQAKSKNFKSREVVGKTIRLEVMDIERLYRHWSEGKPRDELVVDFHEISGGPLPCVFVPGEIYDYSLTFIPGEALRFVYDKYNARLLEANVRSFLSVTGKVNKGIRDTLRNDPERFVAYNNGIVIVADEARLGRTAEGGPGIAWLKGMQIVNGGQTTASIYFSKKKMPEIDLRQVRVPAKIIILHSKDPSDEESLISDISRFANSQNSVKQSDLSANKPFHVELEKLALSTYCPDGVGRWFYERAAGSYNTFLAREGNTPARLKQLKTLVFPPSRKITKTDLAKYLNCWEGKPDQVSFGSQKNFERFMDDLRENEEGSQPILPTVSFFKDMVAKAIIFKKTTALVRPMFPAFQGNVAVYLVALLGDRLRTKIDLEKIWARQDISQGLKQMLQVWAVEVHDVLHRSSGGKMISEWAKKSECWEIVRSAQYSPIPEGISELR